MHPKYTSKSKQTKVIDWSGIVHTTQKSYMSVWMSARTNMNASYMKQDHGTQDIVSTKITSMIESVKQTKYHRISNCHLPEKLGRLSLPCAQRNCSKREAKYEMRAQCGWSSAPELHKPGVVVSACNLSTWEVKSEDQKFKVILTRLWDLLKGKNKKKKKSVKLCSLWRLLNSQRIKNTHM